MSEDAKPRTEVVEETRESLSVLDLDRKPRPEKMAAERAYFDGAHEVRFTERTFRPKHPAALDDIRAFVDSLEVRRREPVAPLPPLAPPEPVAVEPRIPDHYREPLEKVLTGSLLRVETVHRVGTGTVVDVEWEDEGARKGLFLIDEDGARPFEAVASKVDDLPAPRVEPEAKAEASGATPVPPPDEKKRRFGLRKPKEPTEPKGAEEPKAPAAEPGGSKKKGLFRRGK